MKMIIKVKDMNCNNCSSKIQKALLLKGIVCSIDLSKKEVKLANEKQYEEAIKIISENGFTVVK